MPSPLRGLCGTTNGSPGRGSAVGKARDREEAGAGELSVMSSTKQEDLLCNEYMNALPPAFCKNKGVKMRQENLRAMVVLPQSLITPQSYRSSGVVHRLVYTFWVLRLTHGRARGRARGACGYVRQSITIAWSDILIPDCTNFFQHGRIDNPFSERVD